MFHVSDIGLTISTLPLHGRGAEHDQDLSNYMVSASAQRECTHMHVIFPAFLVTTFRKKSSIFKGFAQLIRCQRQ